MIKTRWAYEHTAPLARRTGKQEEKTNNEHYRDIRRTSKYTCNIKDTKD